MFLKTRVLTSGEISKSMLYPCWHTINLCA